MKEGLCQITRADISFEDVAAALGLVRRRIKELEKALHAGEYTTHKRQLLIFRTAQFEKERCEEDFAELFGTEDGDPLYVHLYDWDDNGKPLASYSRRTEVLCRVVAMMDNSDTLFLTADEIVVARDAVRSLVAWNSRKEIDS